MPTARDTSTNYLLPFMAKVIRGYGPHQQIPVILDTIPAHKTQAAAV